MVQQHSDVWALRQPLSLWFSQIFSWACDTLAITSSQAAFNQGDRKNSPEGTSRFSL